MADRTEISKILKGKIKGRLYQKVKLARHTSFGIGGRASYLIDVYDNASLIRTLKVLKANSVKWFLLGAGTNILVSDQGYDGAMIRLKGNFTKATAKSNKIICGAGALISNLSKLARKSNLSGLEFACGIPGTIGGAIKINAGAFGESIGPLVAKVWVVNCKLEVKILNQKHLKFSYRHSNIRENMVIIKAMLNLKQAKPRTIMIKECNCSRWRRLRQPRGKSAGSIFKNPRRISAGQLIEECGLKGMRIGGAIISNQHANFIINRNRAKACDVIRLISLIKKKVYQQKRVKLKEEVILVK